MVEVRAETRHVRGKRGSRGGARGSAMTTRRSASASLSSAQVPVPSMVADPNLVSVARDPKRVFFCGFLCCSVGGQRGEMR